MVTIYKDTRTDKLYALNDMVTMGNKVCLVPFDKTEDKFVAPSTLKRWYTKHDEAQVIVEIKAFTGMKIGLFKVTTYNKDTCTVMTKDNKFLDFSMDTDKQINAKNIRYANKIGQVYGWFIPYWLEKN